MVTYSDSGKESVIVEIRSNFLVLSISSVIPLLKSKSFTEILKNESGSFDIRETS
jgi:hypothetical protein